jgi:hypothetical protein
MLTSTRFEAVTSVYSSSWPLDQKVARIGRASHRRMVEDHISPAVMSEQAIYCGKIHARLPVDIGGGSVVGGLNVHGEVSLAAVYAKAPPA